MKLIYQSLFRVISFLVLYFCNKDFFCDNWHMDYKKKSLNKMNRNETYEEIDTRLASGWYVDTLGSNKTKKYKTNKVSFKISKKV